MSHNNVVLCNLGAGLDEVIDALGWGLEQLGYVVSKQRGAVDYNAINILFAAFGLKVEDTVKQAPRVINYNFEQIGGEPRVPIGAQSFALMRNLPNWDYSPHNIRALNAAGVCDVALVPVGYAPLLERIQPCEKDIDVLFYGSRNERRSATLTALQRAGLNVVWTDAGAWTHPQRDAYIARAKVVLNLAFYDGIHVFEEARVSYLLANRACVVSELSERTAITDDMRPCIVGAPIDQLVDRCLEYCRDANKRAAQAEQGYALFKRRDWLTPLTRAMEDYVTRNPTASRAIKHDVVPPTRINIGSGRAWRFDRINLDIDGTRGADLLFDLNLPFPFEAWLPSWRFGRIRIAKNSVDHILAEHVFEHVRDLVQCMTTCIEWLKVGGELELEVPYDLSFGAWQDPTHVRAFNERSWAYYTDWCWYVGWREYRFEVVSHVHLLSELGRALTTSGMSSDEVTRTPRAVDALRVKLVKRPLSDVEKADHAQYFRTVF